MVRDDDGPSTGSGAPDGAVQDILDRLTQWLLTEVAPVIATGANWKVIVNGSASGDVRAVLEKHQRLSK